MNREPIHPELRVHWSVVAHEVLRAAAEATALAAFVWFAFVAIAVYLTKGSF